MFSLNLNGIFVHVVFVYMLPTINKNYFTLPFFKKSSFLKWDSPPQTNEFSSGF